MLVSRSSKFGISGVQSQGKIPVDVVMQLVERAGTMIPMSDTDLSKAADRKGQMRMVEIEHRLHLIDMQAIRNPTIEPESELSTTDRKSSDLYSRELIELVSRTYNDIDSIFSRGGEVIDISSAGYLLARSSIETSSYANWLMSISNVRTRAFQAYKLFYQNCKNIREVFKEIGRTDVSDFSNWGMRATAQLMEKDIPGKDSKKLESPCTYSTVIKNADEAFGRYKRRDVYTGLTAWRMCSAIVHGNAFLDDVFLTKSMETEVEQHSRKMVAKYSALSLVLLPAIENLEFCCHQFGAQCLEQ